MAKQNRAWQEKDALYLGGLLMITLLFLGPAWQQPDSFWYAPGATYSDLTVTHWPNMWFAARTVRQQGEIPLWRPEIMGGAPYAGNPLAALFYPPNWLFAVLPITPTFHLQYALHVFGAGAALYGLARWGYGCSPFAAFLGGVGYALTPKLIAHMGAGHVGLFQAYAWLPLTVWLLRGAIRHSASVRTAGRWAIACGAALAMAYLADPRVAFYGAMLLAAYATYRLIEQWHTSGGRAALPLALCLLLVPLAAFALGAIQILPTLELMETTTRSATTLEEAGHDSLPVRYLIGYLLADRGGYHEWMTYLGLLPLGLGLLALWYVPAPSRTDDLGQARMAGHARDRWFWAALAVLALLYALGTYAPLYPLLYRLLPAFRWVRVPSRALLLVALVVNLLAAWGTDALLGVDWSPRSRRWAARLAFAGLMTCLGLGAGFVLILGGPPPASIAALAGIGAAACGVWLLSLRPGVHRPILMALLALLLVLDLWPVGHSLIELRPADRVFSEKAAAATYLAAQTGLFRVYSPSYSVPQHVSARLGLEQLDGVDPSQLRWVTSFMSLAGGYPLSGYGVTIPAYPHGTDVRTAWRNATPDATLLGLLNGCYVAAEFPLQTPGLSLEAQEASTYIYRNQRCLPRAYLVVRTEHVGGWEEAQARLAAGYDPSQGALVEGGPALSGQASRRPGADGGQVVSIRQHSPNRIVVEAQAGQPSLLVLSEIWYPGWQVTVDGTPQSYYRVNGITRGVYLEPGAHIVDWEYRPASLLRGAVLTLIGLMGLLGCILWTAGKKG